MLWDRLRRDPWVIDVALVVGLLLFASVWAKRTDDLSVALPLAVAQTLPRRRLRQPFWPASPAG